MSTERKPSQPQPVKKWAKHPKSAKMTDDDRKKVWDHTKKIIYLPEYDIAPAREMKSTDILPNDRDDLIDEAQDKVRKKRIFKTKITVRSQDTLDAARNMRDRAEDAGEKGDDVAVLNMANQEVICGGLDKGSRAQEEDLGRRTNMHRSLSPHAHKTKKLNDNRAVYNDSVFKGETCLYSKGVTVIKGNEDEGFQPISKHRQYKINIISSAAPDLRNERDSNTNKLKNKFSQLVIDGKLKTVSERQQFTQTLLDMLTAYNADPAANKAQKEIYADIMKSDGNPMSDPEIRGYFTQLLNEYVRELDKVIDNILLTALRNGNSKLVVSAHGCGAFKNPAGIVAERWRLKLTGEFENCFDEVEFDILPTPGVKDDNVQIFADILTRGKVESAIQVSSTISLPLNEDRLKDIDTFLKSDDFGFKEYKLGKLNKNKCTLTKSDSNGNNEKIGELNTKSGEIQVIKNGSTTKEDYITVLLILMEGLKKAKNPKINILAKDDTEKDLIKEAFKDIFDVDPELKAKFNKYFLTTEADEYYKKLGIKPSEKNTSGLDDKIQQKVDAAIDDYFKFYDDINQECDVDREELKEKVIEFVTSGNDDTSKLDEFLDQKMGTNQEERDFIGELVGIQADFEHQNQTSHRIS